MPIVWLVVVFFTLTFGIVVFRGAPYVPSRRRYIKQAFTELYDLSDSDILVDVGSGDGVVLREAAKLGAKAIGYEINPVLVLISKLLSQHNDLVKTQMADFWLSQLPDDTTVVYVFAVSRDIEKIAIWLQRETNRLGRKISVITYGSGFGKLMSTKNVGAYKLYYFQSLQSDKAQV